MESALEHDNREEDMLCVTPSFMIKIYCVFYCQPHCEEDIAMYFSSSAVYFYLCVYQIECLRCKVPSWEGLYEWDMQPIKI